MTAAHGTYARYVSKTNPCRCDQCRAANAAYHAEWRKRNGNRDSRTQQYAQVVAARLFRERFPDEWRRLLDNAYDRVTMGEDA